jgi:hypothetical protein
MVLNFYEFNYLQICDNYITNFILSGYYNIRLHNTLLAIYFIFQM